MENVVLSIHLLLALSLIGAVLLQRSEGGGLGIGGGGGVSGRAPSTPMGKVTWILAIAFIATSISLTVIAAQNSASTSVVDRVGGSSAPADDGDAPLLPPSLGAGSLLPPTSGDAPLTPPRAD